MMRIWTCRVRHLRTAVLAGRRLAWRQKSFGSSARRAGYPPPTRWTLSGKPSTPPPPWSSTVPPASLSPPRRRPWGRARGNSTTTPQSANQQTLKGKWPHPREAFRIECLKKPKLGELWSFFQSHFGFQGAVSKPPQLQGSEAGQQQRCGGRGELQGEWGSGGGGGREESEAPLLQENPLCLSSGHCAHFHKPVGFLRRVSPQREAGAGVNGRGIHSRSAH